MTIHQKQTERNGVWLLVGVGFLCALGWLINATSPDGWLPIALLFFLLAGSSYSIGRFVTNHSRRALLISLAITIFFLLHFMNLRHPLYSILLIASLLSLELTAQKR